MLHWFVICAQVACLPNIMLSLMIGLIQYIPIKQFLSAGKTCVSLNDSRQNLMVPRLGTEWLTADEIEQQKGIPTFKRLYKDLQTKEDAKDDMMFQPPKPHIAKERHTSVLREPPDASTGHPLSQTREPLASTREPGSMIREPSPVLQHPSFFFLPIPKRVQRQLPIFLSGNSPGLYWSRQLALSPTRIAAKKHPLPW